MSLLIVVIPPPVPKPHVNVKAALEQRILRFAQIQPSPFSQLLMQVEEMAGVPIRYDKKEIDSTILAKPLTLALTDTTVGDILQAIVHRVGLVHEIKNDGIQIRRADSVHESN